MTTLPCSLQQNPLLNEMGKKVIGEEIFGYGQINLNNMTPFRGFPGLAVCPPTFFPQLKNCSMAMGSVSKCPVQFSGVNIDDVV